MSKKILSSFEFSPFFEKRLDETKNPCFIYDEFIKEKNGPYYTVKFTVHTDELPSLKVETVIAKESLAELENAIIYFFALKPGHHSFKK